MRLIPFENPRWQSTLPCKKRLLLCIAVMMMAVYSGLQAQSPQDVVATVDQHEISAEQFQAYFDRARRLEFYHATPPPEEFAAFRVKTLQDMINKQLLQDEARRRGLHADTTLVEANLAQLTRRYEGNPDWEQHKDVMLVSFQEQLENNNLVEQLENITRDVGAPSEQQLRAYYEAHPKVFTEPIQRRVSLILIGVDPSSRTDTWEAAQEQAERLMERLSDGEDFAMLAEAFSTDITAESGGDMGFLHEGLLNAQAEEAIAALSPGEISPPVRTLEGYAVLRLDDIREPEKKSFDTVRDRATGLWHREEGQKAWERLIETLRETATISVLDPTLQDPSAPKSV